MQESRPLDAVTRCLRGALADVGYFVSGSAGNGEKKNRSDSLFRLPKLPNRFAELYSFRGMEAGPKSLSCFVYVDDRSFTQSADLVFPVHAMFRSYPDREVDLTLRIMSVVEEMASKLSLANAICNSEEGDSWFSYDGISGWTLRPRLVVDESFNYSRDYLEKLVTRNPDILGQDDTEYLVRFSREGSSVEAILRHTLIDGTRLTRIRRHREYHDVTVDAEMHYRRICWRSVRGFADIVDELGPPDASLGSFDFTPEEKTRDLMEDIREQTCYLDIHDQYVVFFREYDDGYLTVTLAGKRKAG
jgi:hypothetical protein